MATLVWPPLALAAPGRLFSLQRRHRDCSRSLGLHLVLALWVICLVAVQDHWFERYGAGSDYLIGAEIVDGTGKIVSVSADTCPDLLWALRGGKYGFGVVTSVTIRLVPAPELYAGALIFSADHLSDVLHGWTDWQAATDSRISTSLAVFHFPPLPNLPDLVRGRSLVFLRFAFPGSAADGEPFAAPLRALAPVVMDGLGPLPADQTARIHSDPTEPGPYFQRGMALARWDHAAADDLITRFARPHQSPLMAFELRQLGGAFARDLPEGSAVSGRAAAFTLSGIGIEIPGISTYGALSNEMAAIKSSLGDRVLSETLINFHGHRATSDEPIWSTETAARLNAIRQVCDPGGVFA